jgi:phosphoesterase RecJ-like protein
LINAIRQIEGVLVSLVIKEKEEGTFKVSVRSEAGFDASLFCSFFGGGGHIAAAGCTLEGEEADVVRRLVEEAERSFA